MAVILLKIPEFDAEAIADTNFDQKVYEIIEHAYRYIGEKVVYNQFTKNLLQIIVLNLQARGYFFWNTEDVIQSFSAPSEVLGDGDGKNYTCYLGHEAASVNRPPTGVDSTKYWYEFGNAGVTWVSGTDNTSTGDFIPFSDTLSVENAFIRFQNRDEPPMNIFSKYQFGLIREKQETGVPRNFFFDDRKPPRIFIHPQIHTDQVSDFILVYRRVVRLSDINGNSEMENFDSYWLHPLILLLAKELAMQRPNFSSERYLILKTEAKEAVNNAIAKRGAKAIIRRGSFHGDNRLELTNRRFVR